MKNKLLALVSFSFHFLFVKAGDQKPLRSDTIYITSYGIRPDSYENAVPAVQAALADCKKSSDPVLVFPRGRYDFWPQHAIERVYYESNSKDNNPKCNAILIDGFKRLVIMGEGSSFIYHGRMQPFTLDHSTNVSIKDLRIDWDIPLTGQGQVIDTAADHIDIRIDEKQYPFIIENKKLVFVGEGWKSGIHMIMEYERGSHLIAPQTADDPLGANWNKYTAEILTPGVVRLHNYFQRRPKPGNILIFRHSDRDHAMIFIRHCKDVSLDHITGYHCAGLGILSQYSEDLSFFGVDIIPNAAKGRYFSGHDGLHFSNCKGEIRIDSCRFGGLMDDPINVHGTYVRIIKKISPDRLLCRFMEHWSRGMEWARRGERIAFVDNSMHTIGQGDVSAFKPLSVTDFELSFQKEIPNGVAIGNGLENLTWTPSMVIKNSAFESCRARGVLVTTPKKVVIENNTFQSSGSAILIAGDVNSWYESGPVRDVLIKNNKFLSPCLTSIYQFCEAIISIDPEMPVMNSTTVPYHRNIRIVDNEFNAFDYPVLFAQSVDGLQFSNNKLLRSHDFTPYHPGRSTITLVGCKNIVIKNNVIDKDLLGKNISLQYMTKKEVDLGQQDLRFN